jgi:sugar/nucleoside kinase (ribokinase family)
MDALKQSDLIFCNENEAQAITNCDNSKDAFAELSKIVPNVAMTLGGKGSRILFESNTYDIHAVNVDVVDTTGAGDMYAGAFLYGLMNFKGNDAVLNAGKLASHASALVVSQLGARYSGSFQDIIEAASK